MGSFNISCFASGQTIAPGDRCRVMPILQNATFRPATLTYDKKQSEQYGITSSGCCADGYWRAQTGFIPAVYDDYGQVKLTLDPLTRAIAMNFFGEVFRMSPTVEAKAEWYIPGFSLGEFFQTHAPNLGPLIIHTRWCDSHEPRYDALLDEEIAATWAHLWFMATECRLFMYSAGAILPLQFTAIHEQAYQSLVDTVSASRNFRGETLEPTAVLTRAMAAARAEQHGEERIPGDIDWVFSGRMQEAVSRGSGNTSYPPSASNRAVGGICRRLRGGAISEAEAVAEMVPLLQDQYSFAALDGFNLKFKPVFTAGQDSDNRIGQAYASFVSTVADKVTAERKALYD